MPGSLRTVPRGDERVDPVEQCCVGWLSERIPGVAGEVGELRHDLFGVTGSERDVDPVERPPQRFRVIDAAVREHGRFVHPHIMRGGGSKFGVQGVTGIASMTQSRPTTRPSPPVCAGCRTHSQM